MSFCEYGVSCEQPCVLERHAQKLQSKGRTVRDIPLFVWVQTQRINSFRRLQRLALYFAAGRPVIA